MQRHKIIQDEKESVRLKRQSLNHIKFGLPIINLVVKENEFYEVIKSPKDKVMFNIYQDGYIIYCRYNETRMITQVWLATKNTILHGTAKEITSKREYLEEIIINYASAYKPELLYSKSSGVKYCKNIDAKVKKELEVAVAKTISHVMHNDIDIAIISEEELKDAYRMNDIFNKSQSILSNLLD